MAGSGDRSAGRNSGASRGGAAPSPRQKRSALRWLGQWAVGVALAAAAIELPLQAGPSAPPERGDPSPAVLDAPTPTSKLPRAARPVASYTIAAALDAAEHLVDATATVRWTNTSAVAQHELYWHLYLNAFEHERTLFARDELADGFRGGATPATFGHVSVRRMYWRERDHELWPGADGHSPGEPDDRTDIRVPLPEPIAPGETATFELSWESRLPAIVLRTGYAGPFHMVAQWYPKLARLEPDGTWAHFPFHRLSEFYADFGDYDVTVEVPDDFVVAGTGKLVEQTAIGARGRWRFQQSSVHDFAFATGNRLETMAATSPDGVEVRCLYPRGLDWAARRQIDAALFGLAHYSSAYGDYPYETLTLVHPPDEAFEAGGMEYPTLITTGSYWVYERLGAHSLEQVTLHELAHQWFYGIVATDEHAWPFLDEGLTSYAEAEALEARHPGASAFSLFGFEVGLPALVRAWSRSSWTRDVVAKPAPEFGRGSDYGGLVYGKTATILQTLARVYGAEAVRRALGRYARQYRFAHPEPEELIELFGVELGETAAAALRAGLFEKGSVDFAVESITATGSATTVVVTRKGPIALPVEVELWRADGVRETRTWDGEGDTTAITYAGPSPLVGARVDPHHRMLLDPDWANNALRAQSPSAWPTLAPRVLDQLGFAASILLAAAGP